MLCLFNEFSEGREGALNGLYAHIVVHLLTHESGLRISFGLFTDSESVQLANIT